MLALGGIAFFKQRDISKIKKLITAEYDKMADDIAKEMKKSNLEFVKPKLEFKNLEKDTMGAYAPNSNIIKINTNFLSPKKWLKFTNKNVSIDQYSDGKITLANMFILNSKHNRKIENCVEPTLSELMMHHKSSLSHELEHARQLQISLQADGAQDFILKILKEKYPNMSDDEIKRSSKFLFGFSPRKNFSLDTQTAMGDLRVTTPKDKKVNTKFFKPISSDGAENLYIPVYTPRTMINELIGDYASTENLDKYYGNLGEIFARRAEFDCASSGCFNGVDEEVVNTFKEIKKLNYESLLHYTAFNKE